MSSCFVCRYAACLEGLSAIAELLVYALVTCTGYYLEQSVNDSLCGCVSSIFEVFIRALCHIRRFVTVKQGRRKPRRNLYRKWNEFEDEGS